MQQLWAPWRIEYIRMEKMDECIFCKLPNGDDEKNLILYRGKHAFVIMNNYPYNPGHVMVAPYRHVGEIEDLSEEEWEDVHALTALMVRAIKRTMNPQGFNIGLNIGRVAGAGIEGHLHVHIVPRWNGDTNFMPVISDTKVIVQGIRENYKELKREIEKLISSSEQQ